MDVQNHFSENFSNIYIRKTIIVKEGKYMTKEKKTLPDGWYTVKLLDAKDKIKM